MESAISSRSPGVPFSGNQYLKTKIWALELYVVTSLPWCLGLFSGQSLDEFSPVLDVKKQKANNLMSLYCHFQDKLNHTGCNLFGFILYLFSLKLSSWFLTAVTPKAFNLRKSNCMCGSRGGRECCRIAISTGQSPEADGKSNLC